MNLDYDLLVASYKKNLEENLRGFSGGPGFLELWTLDENPHRSIADLISLADDHHIDILNLKVGKEICDHAELGGFKNGVVTRLNETTIQYLSQKGIEIYGFLLVAISQLELATEFNIVDIKGNVVTLSYAEQRSEFSNSLISIERHVSKLLGSKVVLLSEALEDKNRRDRRIH